jgi:hypothetical protein
MMTPALRALLLLFVTASAVAAAPIVADVCVYGGSAGGVAAAVQAARMGVTVVLVEPGQHIGGAAVEGLGSSDIDNHADFKNAAAVGGIAAEFYRRVGQHYGREDPVYRFEPHVAERVYDAMAREAGVRVLRGERLLEPLPQSVAKEGQRLRRLRLEGGAEVEARVFIDATIEGDLLAAAAVTTIIGREPNHVYGETKNGIRGENTYRQFTVAVDPYVVPGDPRSGVIATIQDEPFGTPGEGDHRIQAYCFRLTLTKDPANRIPFAKPPGFRRENYEIYLRYLRAGGKLFAPQARLPNGKTDLGSWHDLSLNLYGMNHEYPGGSYATRARVLREHLEFTQGLCWFLANDPEVPEATRAQWRDWGVCKDEFTDHGGWPRMFYVRDARRMVADYVITEHHTRRASQRAVEDPVALAYWPPDTHHVRRIVREGRAYNEGFVFGGDDWAPFGIAWRAVMPRASEAENLLTPTCPSSSHVAYGAIRIEWTFMALGQACGTGAVLALAHDGRVHAVDYAALRARLLADGQVLALPPR